MFPTEILSEKYRFLELSYYKRHNMKHMLKLIEGYVELVILETHVQTQQVVHE